MEEVNLVNNNKHNIEMMMMIMLRCKLTKMDILKKLLAQESKKLEPPLYNKWMKIIIRMV